MALTKFDPITNSNLSNNTIVVVFQYADYVTGGYFAPALVYSSIILVYMVLILSSQKKYAVVAATVIGLFIAFSLVSAGVLHPIHLLFTFLMTAAGFYISRERHDL